MFVVCYFCLLLFVVCCLVLLLLLLLLCCLVLLLLLLLFVVAVAGPLLGGRFAALLYFSFNGLLIFYYLFYVWQCCKAAIFSFFLFLFYFVGFKTDRGWLTKSSPEFYDPILEHSRVRNLDRGDIWLLDDSPVILEVGCNFFYPFYTKRFFFVFVAFFVFFYDGLDAVLNVKC